MERESRTAPLSKRSVVHYTRGGSMIHHGCGVREVPCASGKCVCSVLFCGLEGQAGRTCEAVAGRASVHVRFLYSPPRPFHEGLCYSLILPPYSCIYIYIYVCLFSVLITSVFLPFRSPLGSHSRQRDTPPPPPLPFPTTTECCVYSPAPYSLRLFVSSSQKGPMRRFRDLRAASQEQ